MNISQITFYDSTASVYGTPTISIKLWAGHHHRKILIKLSFMVILNTKIVNFRNEKVQFFFEFARFKFKKWDISVKMVIFVPKNMILGATFRTLVSLTAFQGNNPQC